MAWPAFISRTTMIFSRRASAATGARLTTHLAPSRVPTSWSWTTSAGGRVLGTSPWRRTTPTAHDVRRPPRAIDDDDDNSGGQTLVQAIVGVVVLGCDGGEPPHDVYGSVTATTTTTVAASGEPPLRRYSLLDKAKVEPVRVPEETAAIPLQRERISAPLRSQLEVSAHLWNLNNAYYYYGGDDEIADGSVAFTPRLAGASLAGTDRAVTIHGKHGKVRVDVTWSPI